MNTRISSANYNRHQERQGGLVRMILALGALACLASPAWATDRYWTSGASNGRWSDPNNWDPVGTPQNDDDLWFGYRPVDIAGSGNDLTNLRIHSLHFADTGDLLTGNALTIADAIVSEGRDHQVVIMCPLVFSGNATVQVGSSAGFLGELQSYLDLEGPLVVNAPHTVELDAQADDSESGGIGVITILGPMSGNGDIKARTGVAGDHAGVVLFGGLSTNAFSGRMHLDAPSPSQIQFNNMYHPVVTNRLVVDYGKTANLMLYSASQIANTTTIEVDGGGQLILKGYNVTVNALVLSNYTADAAASTLDTGSTTLGLNGGIVCWNENQSFVPTIKGTVNLNGVLPFTLTGPAYAGLDVQATLAGPGGFNKSGNPALILEGNNVFTGAASVDQGILDVRSTGALGSTAGGTSLTGNGSLTLRNVNIAGETLFSEGNQPVTAETSGSLLFCIGPCSWGGPIQLDQNLVVYADNTTLSGPISGAAGLDFRNGTAFLGGSLANTYAGTTLVRCSLLGLNKPSMFRAYGGPLVVGGGGGGPYEARWLNQFQAIVGPPLTLYDNGIVNLNGWNQDFGPVTFNGGLLDTGTGRCLIYQPLTVNPSASTAVINGNLGLPPGADRVFNVRDGVADPDLLVNAVVFGNPGTYFVKQGAGSMSLANFNTFNAPTLLETGILSIDNGSGLGTWPGLIIFDGGTLQVSGAATTGGGIEMIGSGVGGTHGAIEVLPNASFGTSGNVLLDGPTTLNIGSGGGLELGGSIVGTGPLTKTGEGVMNLTGGANNSYSGDTIVSSGGLYLGKSPGSAAVPGQLVIGPGPAGPTTFARLLQSGGLGAATVTVNANSLFDLNGFHQSITTLNLRDGGSVQTGNGLLDFPLGGAINVGSLNLIGSHASSTIVGAIGLPPNATLNFNVGPYAPGFSFASEPELDVPATIPRPVEELGFAPAGITKTGLGRMRLSANNTYAGSTLINGGTLTVNGTQPQSLVAVNSGTLGGSGTVGDIYMSSSAAVVAPGDGGPGTLTCGNFNPGIAAIGTLRMKLNGDTPSSGYDQLNVRGTVNLAGVVLQRSLGFSPPTGTQFDIISNDGRDFVTGTFNGLPDGGKLYIGGVIYQINYGFGGRPGNDVALQGLDTPPPPPPTLTIQRLPPASVRLLWPVSDPPFDLQTCTNLDTASWTPALPPPTVSGTNNIVSNPTLNAQQFYRLISP